MLLLGQMDTATVVAPKKKFLAAQAEAAASDSSAANKAAAPSLGAQTTANSDGKIVEARASSHSTSFSVRDNAPAGARSADDEEIVRFQNTQLFAANQVFMRTLPESMYN